MSLPFDASPVDLLQALVRIPSVNPDGDPGTESENQGERQIAVAVGEFLERCAAGRRSR